MGWVWGHPSASSLVVLWAAGEDIAGVSGTLGHSTVSTTLNIYTTARERGKESAMGAVERALREHAPAQVVKFDRDGTQG